MKRVSRFHRGSFLMPVNWMTKLVRLLRHNVRVPDRVMGDIWSQLAAHQLMERRLQELLEEQGFERPGRRSPRRLSAPRAGPCNRPFATCPMVSTPTVCKLMALTATPLTLAATVRVADEHIVVDYNGTSPQVGARAKRGTQLTRIAFTTYATQVSSWPPTLTQQRRLL